MLVFLSYSREDVERITMLRSDLELAGHEVWLDERLSGGQQWWDSILAKIRQADVFALAVTEASVQSEACLAEARYAEICGLPVIPVRLEEQLDAELTPEPLPRFQWISYLKGDKADLAQLLIAVRESRRRALPDPLPADPPVPMSYVAELKQAVASTRELTRDEQVLLLDRFESQVDDAKNAQRLAALLSDFRRRDDLRANLLPRIDSLLERILELESQPASEPASWRAGAPPLDDEASSFSDQPHPKERTVTETEGELSMSLAKLEEQAIATNGFLVGLLDAFGLEGEVTTKAQWGPTPTEDTQVIVADVTGEQTEALVGSRGETLEAITEICRTVVQRKTLQPVRLNLDIAGYRERRRQALEIYARRLAEEVTRDRNEVELEAMSPADRKVVDEVIADIQGVRTYSEGEEPDRAVVIAPIESSTPDRRRPVPSGSQMPAEWVEATGKSVDLAVQAGLNELKIGRSEAEIEVLQHAERGFLGLGKDARVRVRRATRGRFRMAIKDEIGAELRDAMKAGDVPRRDALRQIQTEVAKAKAKPGYSGAVDDDLYLKVIGSCVREMKRLRDRYAKLGARGREQADKLTFEIEYLGRWLPETLGEEETVEIVAATIAELGVAADPKHAGRVTGHIMKSGREGLDGALVDRLVREHLGGG